MNANDILPKLKKVKATHNGWVALCPAHDDQKQSLSISEKDGKILMNCFAGCTYSEIIEAIGISSNGNGGNSNRKIDAIYDYTDEHGNLIYQIVRFEGKQFRQRHIDNDRNEVWNLNGVQRVPYRFQELINLTSLQDVVMTEGEKDADTLTKLGFPATNHKNWREEFNWLLKDKNVLIFIDHDRAGIEQGKKIVSMIRSHAKAIKVVDCDRNEPLPDKHGKDISDYLQKNGLEDLRELVKYTPVYFSSNDSIKEHVTNNSTDENVPNLFLVKSANEWIDEAKNRPAPKMLFGELWFEGEICILFSDTNLGKSILAVQIAESIARGEQIEFFKLTAPAQKVLYFDFELSNKQFELRYSTQQGDYLGNHYRFSENFYRAEINPEGEIPERFENFEDYLNYSLQQMIVDTDANILIVDNLTYLRDETEKAKNALPLMKHLKHLKSRFGLSILVFAHTPKSDLSKRIKRNDLAGYKILINLFY
jgi:DNA primase